jgi:hypothetical protein
VCVQVLQADVSIPRRAWSELADALL